MTLACFVGRSGIDSHLGQQAGVAYLPTWVASAAVDEVRYEPCDGLSGVSRPALVVACMPAWLYRLNIAVCPSRLYHVRRAVRPEDARQRWMELPRPPRN